jgi:hypothetical protein
MPLLWMLYNGKGQLMITTRRRLWIFSPRNVMLKTGLIALTTIALMYSILLGFRVQQSEAATARIGTVTNTYMTRNSAQAERSRQIRLLTSTYILKGFVNSEAAVAEKKAFRVLREPYPSIKEVEKHLGAADFREMYGQEVHLVWNKIAWQKPKEWPDGKTIQTWPCTTSKVIEAWFDKSGAITELSMAPETDGTKLEIIGRTPEDWIIAP